MKIEKTDLFDGDNPEPQARVRIGLTRAEAFRAAAWLESNWNALRGMTRAKAAGALTEILGKPVATSTLSHLLRDMSREWPGRGPVRGKVSKDRVRALARQVLYMNQKIEEICKSLGIDPEGGADPDMLADLAGGRRAHKAG